MTETSLRASGLNEGASLRDRATPAEPVVSALRAGIASAWKCLKGYFADMWGLFSPFLLCVMGGVFASIMAGTDGGGRWVAAALASATWFWALDFAGKRAAAKRDSEWGARTLAMVMDDHYTEITVTNKQVFYADEATRAAMAAQVDGNPKGGDAKQAPGESLTARSRSDAP